MTMLGDKTLVEKFGEDLLVAMKYQLIDGHEELPDISMTYTVWNTWYLIRKYIKEYKLVIIPETEEEFFRRVHKRMVNSLKKGDTKWDFRSIEVDFGWYMDEYRDYLREKV